MLGDLRNPRWMYLKAILLILIALMACTILLLDSPHVRTALLLLVTIWAFCRAYYFAFYVIEHYIDPAYKFAGLFDFAKYLWKEHGRE
jgi:uncharacterized RDD family membrane protein YckC